MPQSIIGLQLIAAAKTLECGARDLLREGYGVDADRALDRAIDLRARAADPEASMEESVS